MPVKGAARAAEAKGVEVMAVAVVETESAMEERAAAMGVGATAVAGTAVERGAEARGVEVMAVAVVEAERRWRREWRRWEWGATAVAGTAVEIDGGEGGGPQHFAHLSTATLPRGVWGDNWRHEKNC